METPFIIVCLILVALVFIPYLLFITAGKSENDKMKTKIKDVIANNNLNISTYDKWGLRYLGIDTVQRKLVFLKNSFAIDGNPSEELVQLIDIDAIKSCNILELRKPIKIGDRKEVILEKLDLEILLKNDEKLILSFYHMDEEQMEDWELRRVEKWKAILMELSSNTAGLKKAA
jgi:hypothetical protein